MDKAELRSVYVKRRRSMPLSLVESESEQISQRLIARIDWSAVRTMHVYDPIVGSNEVRTAGIVEHLLRFQPSITLVQSKAGRTAPLPMTKFDLIIVPLLAFDGELNRLGFGGGWYDRFLSRQPAALKVGLAFEAQSAPSIPSEPFDVPLDMLITERRVIMKSASRR